MNSPGGEGIAAERIVNVCRSYSPNNSFSAIVPRRAKSAATMICFGATQIGMSRTSELGPVDPQIMVSDDQGRPVSIHAAHEIIESYEDLMTKANRTKGRVDPCLQQLARFDAKDIRRIRSAQALSSSISIKCLKTGVMARHSNADIEKKLKPFLDPTYTKMHSRPIHYDVAQQCGLPVVLHDLRRSVMDNRVRTLHAVESILHQSCIQSDRDSKTICSPHRSLSKWKGGLTNRKKSQVKKKKKLTLDKGILKFFPKVSRMGEPLPTQWKDRPSFAPWSVK